MGKIVFLQNFRKLFASVLCFFVSGTVCGSIKSDLGGFWFIFFSLFIFFPKVGHRDDAAERNHRRKRAINSLPSLRWPQNST